MVRSSRAVFKWLSKVITWLRLLRLVIGLKDSRQFFNQWEAKPKPIAPCTRDISRASGALQVIARNCDWFMELFVPVVIGRSNCFGFGFSTVISKPLYCQTNDFSILWWKPTLSIVMIRLSELVSTKFPFKWVTKRVIKFGVLNRVIHERCWRTLQGGLRKGSPNKFVISRSAQPNSSLLLLIYLWFRKKTKKSSTSVEPWIKTS